MKALLELAAIPRSTYYYVIKTFDKPDKDAELKDIIQAIYKEHQGRYGYRRIRDELVNRGHRVNHKKVQRLMNILGLKSLVRMKKIPFLERDFHAKKPNEKWVTDLTHKRIKAKLKGMSSVLDRAHSQSVA